MKILYLEAITAIRTDPFCGLPKSGDLKGIYGYDVFYKGTNYELAYRLEENEEGEIVVVILGRVFKPRWKQILPNFRAQQGTFPKACWGTSRESDEASLESYTL